MDREYFLEKHGVSVSEFHNTGLVWDDLMEIRDDYTKRLTSYEDSAKYIADCLNKVRSIHSIKYRIKDRERLIEKIIKKTIQDPEIRITLNNYRQKIKDLIGIRALHLFKEDWIDIHDYIFDNWELFAIPKVNYKKGDPYQLLDSYVEKGLTLNEHAFGYRSIHYNIRVKSGAQEMIAEIQLRTLFEEAWSEIDHHIRYSRNEENDGAELYLGILNNITSNADKIASHIRRLQTIELMANQDTITGMYNETRTEPQTETQNEKYNVTQTETHNETQTENQTETQLEKQTETQPEKYKVRDIYKTVKQYH